MISAFSNQHCLMSGFVKFLLFLLIGAGIALGCLWFLGGKKQEYYTAISINALPQQVFPYLVEPLQVKKWKAGLVDTELLSEGPVQLGTKSLSTVQRDGENRTYQDEVIRFQQDQVFTVRSRDPSTLLSSLFTLENVAGKTGLSYRVKLTTRGFNRFFVPFQDAQQRQQEIVQDARALKKIVESEIAMMPVDIRNGPAEESSLEGDGLSDRK